MKLTPCLLGEKPWTPPEDKVWVGNEVFFDVRWRDAVSWPGWVGVAKCGSRLFYGFDGRAEVMSRVVPRVNFGKKRKEIGDEQVDFG